MKVLKKGRPQKDWAAKFVCTGKGNDGGGCGAKLLVEQADLFKQYSQIRDETTTYLSFLCCECGVKTDFGLMNHASLVLFQMKSSTKLSQGSAK